MVERADAGGLTNVRVCCSSIEGFPAASDNQQFNLVVSLHAGGSASDHAIAQAVSARVPYCVR